MKKTDIEKLRSLAIDFLCLEPEIVEEIPVFIMHPFFESRFVMNNRGETFDIFEDTNKFSALIEQYKTELKSASLDKIFAIMMAKYHLAYLKYAKPHMSKNDFEKYLAFAWVHSENPNKDINVSISELIKWFRNSDKNNLMEADEQKYYDSLPETVEIYRGVAVGRAESEGLSWTCNYDTAKWFSERFDRDDEKGYIIKAKIHKEDIFAYFNGRDEDEVLCDSSKIFDKEIINNKPRKDKDDKEIE